MKTYIEKTALMKLLWNYRNNKRFESGGIWWEHLLNDVDKLGTESTKASKIKANDLEKACSLAEDRDYKLAMLDQIKNATYVDFGGIEFGPFDVDAVVSIVCKDAVAELYKKELKRIEDKLAELGVEV